MMTYEFDSMKLGLAVRLKRKMIGLSVREVSELTNLSTAAITNIEGGDIAPSVATLSRLCTWLDPDPCEFWKKTR